MTISKYTVASGAWRYKATGRTRTGQLFHHIGTYDHELLAQAAIDIFFVSGAKLNKTNKRMFSVDDQGRLTHVSLGPFNSYEDGLQAAILLDAIRPG